MSHGKWGAQNPQSGYAMNSYGYNNQNAGGYGGYNPPPAYGQQTQNQQYTGQPYNPNEGYYGPQYSGVQQPSHTYQRDDVYSPPAGPPPGK